MSIRDEIKAALSVPGVKAIDIPGKAVIDIRTEYVTDYEGKLITSSQFSVHHYTYFTVEGPRVNSNDMDLQLDEAMSNDEDLSALLEGIE